MTKTYIDELAEEIAKLREENKRLKEENRALAMGSFPLMIEGANKIEKLKSLLKECNLLLIKQQANDEVEHKESAELVLRIEEVLK